METSREREGFRFEKFDGDNVEMKVINKTNIFEVIEALRNNLMSPAVFDVEKNEILMMKL